MRLYQFRCLVAVDEALQPFNNSHICQMLPKIDILRVTISSNTDSLSVVSPRGGFGSLLHRNVESGTLLV
jgi:hypothetical protein